MWGYAPWPCGHVGVFLGFSAFLMAILVAMLVRLLAVLLPVGDFSRREPRSAAGTILDVSGIECVGVVKSCPRGQFAAGTKVAALMGGLGRTINGSYAEYTRAPVTNVAAMEPGISWADLAALPESYATAWTCLFVDRHVQGRLAEGRGRSDG
jgi:NADPH:quinone reductase-like Zn-dependent oxidoreductase